MSGQPLTLEAMEARIRQMTPAQVADLRKLAAKQLARPWNPQPGPQTECFYSEADETLYGGSAGGGKTDVLLGLATTAHERSIIFRRQSVDLETIWNRLVSITAGRAVKSDGQRKKMRLNDGRFIEFGHLEKPGSEKGYQGNPHDLAGFDEAAQLEEAKVIFVMQWLRSTTLGQRVRAVFATNPPIPEFDKAGRILDTGTGQWLIEWFAPWLQEGYPDPAQDGELRWCYMRQEGDRMKTIWVDRPGAYDLETAQPVPNATDEDVNRGRVAVAKSRTFIRSRLENNAFLKNSGYAQRMSATPEPLRSLLLNGSFVHKGEDHPMQVIPTLHVLAAQERWRARHMAGEHKQLKQLVLSGDVAQGGMASSVLAALYTTDYFDEPFSQPGRKTPTGKEVVAMVLQRRQDASLVVLDGTGGWGGSTRDKLVDDHKFVEGEDLEMFLWSAASHEWADDMWKCLNSRAEAWWAFRKALDPKSGFEICLPPSTRLQTQLTAPLFEIKGKTLQIEDKEAVMTRIGSSTDEADAVIQAWHYREQAIARRFKFRPDIVARIVHGKTAEMLEREQGEAMPLDDPLRGYR